MPAAGAPTLTEFLDLCGELLHTAAPAPESDFFTLGGNSLTALELTAAVEARWGCELPIADVFVAPNLEAVHHSLTTETPARQEV
ncbi:phosphopantetheine-binding protein [Streptacidiphilus cavernicola]|uniref:Phosphopantetheine-binding protein n=1 Tax=Streptacidiphilus cavernicola TaxID=3342716 RepID=A0ABV6VZZ9_9ACTN